jgi:UDP-N-acetylmuramoyl-tripeptide--D-alanyl-D-alanine ligase
MGSDIYYSRFFIILLSIPWLVYVYICSLDLLHILQLEGYKNKGFSRWIKTHPHRVFPQREKLYGKILFLAGVISWIVGTNYIFFLFAALWLILVLLLIYKREKRKYKKPLVFTKRVVRLLTLHKGFFLAEIIFLFWLFYRPTASVLPWSEAYVGRSIIFLWCVCILGIIAPYHLMLVNGLLQPVEKLINTWYFMQARQKVRTSPNLNIVGITGSYGKTSTKIIANAVLSTNYETLTTPESYNTPMGVCKVINANKMSAYQYFVVEMGARYVGDIKELCKLTPPKIGILTSVGSQHLETFGSLSTIYQTKKELADALPHGGTLIINGDDPNCIEAADSVPVKVVRYGIKGKDLDFKAIHIKTTPSGLYFRMKNRQGETFKVQSRLLGRHNVYNLLAGVALGSVCDIKEKEAVSALAEVEPVPHRLQLIQSSGGATVIDDAYNANPTGAANALDVLAEFKSGRKILVTPGFVELGADEDNENRELGRNAAAVCDWVFLVGAKKTEAIRQGLLDVGFNPSMLMSVNNLDQVTEKLKQIVKPGDVILFENDLPDQYTETL